jgi:hypothetical protein
MELYDRCPGCGRLYAAVGREHACEPFGKELIQSLKEARAIARELTAEEAAEQKAFVDKIGKMPADRQKPNPFATSVVSGVADPIQDDRAAWPAVRPPRDYAAHTAYMRECLRRKREAAKKALNWTAEELAAFDTTRPAIVTKAAKQ